MEQNFTDFVTACLHLMGIDLPNEQAKHIIPLDTFSQKERQFLDEIGVIEVYVRRCRNALNGYVKICLKEDYVDTIRHVYLYYILIEDSIVGPTNNQ